MFQIIPGQAALPSFRLEKLRAAISALNHNILLVGTRHWYFIALNEDALMQHASARLERILGLGSAPDLTDQHELQQVLVVPRLGTISPWSSKATDIAQHCGLSDVQRIERGLGYYLQSRNVKT